MGPSQRSLPRNLRGPSLLPGLHPLLPALDLVKSRKRDYSWDPSSLTHELWAGAFPGASLGKQRAKPHPGSLPQPPSLGLQWLLVLANNVCPSSFLLRKPLLGRGDIGAECSLGQKVGEMAGWPALFLEKIRARAKQSTGICWHRPPPKEGKFWVPSLSPEILHGWGNGLDVSRAHSPPTLAQHSSHPRPW